MNILGYEHDHMKVCYWMERSKQPFWWYAFTGFLSCIWNWIQAQRCRYQGHDIIDESLTGPDTGHESFHCARCGWDFDHTYY